MSAESGVDEPWQLGGDQPRGRRRWIAGALVAQLFMISAYVAVITSGAGTGLVVLALVFMLAFSAVYVFVIGRLVLAPLHRRILAVAALWCLSLPVFPVLGTSTSGLWIFVAVAGGMLFPAIPALSLGVALAVLMIVIDLVAGESASWELALTLVALTSFMAGFAANLRLNIELRRTREQLAVAAVAAERERIGRDLHDILGHSLTAIAVKSGLARRLLDRDPVAAATEIADVERLARDALSDVRATASGYREVSLATELAVAGSVLRAAGVTARLPVAVDDVDPTVREAFGYVVREAVTNVVRHSGARNCEVVLGRNTIEITDDGPGVERIVLKGQSGGLRGLADRLAAVGGTVEAGPRRGGGFAVRAAVPVAPSDADSGAAATAPSAAPRSTPGPVEPFTVDPQQARP